jgi:hypothetical protein
MPRPKKELRTPGHEPALSGRADPIPVAPNLQRTHMPAGGGIGTICGVRPVPTHAAEYSATAPSCPTCAAYLKASQDHSAAILRSRRAIAEKAQE